LLPIVSVPFIGGISIFDASAIFGLILIGAGAATAWFAHNNNYKPFLATGAVGAAIIIYALIRYNSMKSGITGGGDGNNPFAQMAQDAIKLNVLGWLPLLGGTGLALWIGNKARTNNGSPGSPSS
jgi:hypothetical protein